MTNAQIIAKAQEAAGIDLETPCHTFAYWKSIGFSVKKGEKATFKANIWKHTSKKVKNEQGKEEEQSSMFIKTASFFTAEQVQALA